MPLEAVLSAELRLDTKHETELPWPHFAFAAMPLTVMVAVPVSYSICCCVPRHPTRQRRRTVHLEGLSIAAELSHGDRIVRTATGRGCGQHDI